MNDAQDLPAAGHNRPPGAAAPVVPRARGGSGVEGLSPMELAFPTIEDLRQRAQRRTPKFAYDFVSCGCGENLATARNRAAFDAVEILPRYGLGNLAIDTSVELFGRRYAAPIGMAPMGMGGLLWPHMELHLAAAAQAANIPYVLATPASASIEAIGRIAPDVFWFQSYGQPRDDYRITFDLLRRAADAGARALLVTIDTPVRAKRPQDARNRLAVPFRPRLGTMLDIARHPAWALATLRAGTPRCENFLAYMQGTPSATDVANFVAGQTRGGYEWNTIARLRDAWPNALVIKGVLHPNDAEQARAIGADGIVVSNHGGRTFDGAPAAIDMLPAVKSRAGGMTILLDSGPRSGLDIARAIAVGAHSTITGRPFQYGVAAAGAAGARHAVHIFIDELRQMMGQIGVRTLSELAQVEFRQPRAAAYANLGQ